MLKVLKVKIMNDIIIVCPVCGCVLAPDDVVYKNAENEYIGCQECIESREAIELTFENCN